MQRTTSYTDSWYPQPAPVSLADGPESTARQWPLVAAGWLLASWAADGPNWRTTYFTGTAADRDAQPWPQPPPLAEIARIAGFPESGPGQPVAATVLTSLVQPEPGRPWGATRPRAEVVAQVVGELTARIGPESPRAVRLLTYLAQELVGKYDDVLLVSTGDDDLHLVQRYYRGPTLRLTVASTPGRPPTIPADDPDAALRTRLACIMTLLSEMLWVNNNNPVTFRAWLGPAGDDDPQILAAQHWQATREEETDEPDEAPQFRVLTVEELRAVLHHVARGGLTELFDTMGDDGGWPELPADHLASFLCADLVDLLLAHATGPDGPPRIVGTGYLPVTWPGDDDSADEYDEIGTVLILGSAGTAVLDIDVTC